MMMESSLFGTLSIHTMTNFDDRVVTGARFLGTNRSRGTGMAVWAGTRANSPNIDLFETNTILLDQKPHGFGLGPMTG
jgi:hypothetical protein